MYGHLKVVGFGGYRGTAILWQCRCTLCGSIEQYYRANLRSGNSTQCLDCNRKFFTESSTSHGMNRTPIYRTWERVRRTEGCCRKWEKFQAFYDDVGDKPSPDHFLVRKDSKKGWKPSNAIWIHKSKAKQGGSNIRMIRHKGRTASLIEWAEEIGITTQTLRGRFKRGWSTKKALETPSLKPKKKKAKKKSPKKKPVKKKSTRKNAVKKKLAKKTTVKKKPSRKKARSTGVKKR